jgi:hypothetical protein
MEQQPGTWDDVFRENGVDPDAIRRQENIDKYTCVIRSLSSVVGLDAPDELYDLRLSQIKSDPMEAIDIYFLAKERGVSFVDLLNEIQAADRQDVSDLLRIAASGSSEFAHRLSTYKPELTVLDASSMKDSIKNGVPIIVLGYISEGETYYYHAMHLGMDSQGRYICLSDNNTHIEISDDLTTHCLVFHPK